MLMTAIRDQQRMPESLINFIIFFSFSYFFIIFFFLLLSFLSFIFSSFLSLILILFFAFTNKAPSFAFWSAHPPEHPSSLHPYQQGRHVALQRSLDEARCIDLIRIPIHH